MNKIKVVFFDMGNTLLHFHTGKSDDEKDIEGLKILTQYLNKLRALGYKIGVISNTCYYDEVMKECFKKAGISDLIDSFTFSYSLKVGKPDKEIFKHALEKMNVLPNEAIMIGDNLNSDIKPAQEIGMYTILFNKNNEELSSEIIPNDIITDLSEIPIYLNRKFNDNRSDL